MRKDVGILGRPGRLDQQFTRWRPFHWSRFPTRSRVLYCLCVPEHNLDLHDMQHGRKVQEYLGHEYASSYFSVVTLVVESVLPYTLSGIAFLVSLGVGSPTSAFISVYLLMMCISPQMLILRVIVGRSWDKDTFKQPVSTVKFSPGVSSSGSWFDGSGARVHLQTLSNVYIPDRHAKVVISQLELTSVAVRVHICSRTRVVSPSTLATLSPRAHPHPHFGT
ncbi:hypothetical protein OG21DRAFT_1059743 [Imleria badia]|nr:hypothetical protein OG21DRAFT_1059743 [Imleria badia]